MSIAPTLLPVAACWALYQQQAPLDTDNWPIAEPTWTQFYGGHAPASDTPRWIHRGQDSGAAVALLLVHAELAAFRGHFPGQPLLPGVVQINWAVALAAEQLQSAYAPQRFAGLSRIKFKVPVLPGALVAFELKPAPGRLALRVTSQAQVHTQGHLLYRD